MPLLTPGVRNAPSNVFARVVDPISGRAGHLLLDTAELWSIASGTRLRPPVTGQGSHAFAGVPSVAAAQEGWIVLSPPPGTYVLRLRATGAAAAGGQRDVTFTVPEAPGDYFIGTFRVPCTHPAIAGPTAGCRIEPAVADETAEARAMLAAIVTRSVPMQPRVAQSYPPPIARLGLAPPTTPEIVVDARQWLAAIDWSAFGAPVPAQRAAPDPTPRGNPVPPAGETPGDRRSEATEFDGAVMVATRTMLSDMQGIVPDMRGLGALAELALSGHLVLPVMIGMAIVLMPFAVLVHAIESDRTRTRTAAEAEQQAAALRAAAEAQERWGACTASIAATLSPGNAERHLRTTLSTPAAGRGPVWQVPWQVTVTRVILRHCGTSPEHYGIEVATRWTAWRAGTAEPAYDAAFSRTVAGATLDPRLVHPTRPPFEASVASEAACRPLAEWCAPGGASLLLEEVVLGVTEARDAVAAAR